MKKSRRREVIAVLLVSLFAAAFSFKGAGPQDQHVLIRINGQDTERTFEGIGAVSAGASSRLLIDYAEPYRSDILDYLFKPRFGAGFQHLKVEIGGGYNSTDGSEPSFARTRAEMSHPDFKRGYEYWLMRMARDRNPDVVLDCLPWTYPAWFAGGELSQDAADYTVRFIQGAKSQWGLDIDYTAGHRNELPWNKKTDRDWLVNVLRPTLNRSGLSAVKIVAADETGDKHWSIADQMVTDSALLNAVDAIGSHYPNGTITSNCLKTGKPLWASEDFSTPGDWSDAFKLAMELNRNYVKGKMTATELWCPINSFYDNLLCPATGAMRANTPWCGYYEVSPAVWAVAHTTQFAEPGWKYVGSGCGSLPGGENYYVTLKKPGSGQYSIIIADKNYAGTASFQLSGGLSTGVVHVWKSDSIRQFIRIKDITPVNGSFSIKLDTDAIYSLTTTTGQLKGIPPHAIPARKAFPFPYTENFESYPAGATPKYFSDQHGTFEVAQTSKGHKVLRQEIDRSGIIWYNSAYPYTIVGDTAWRNYSVSVDAFLEDTGTVALLGRVNDQTNWNIRMPDAYVLSLDHTGKWMLKVNYMQKADKQADRLLASGKISPPSSRRHSLKLIFQGNHIRAFIDGKSLADITDQTYVSGMTGLATGWNHADFDNLEVVRGGDIR